MMNEIDLKAFSYPELGELKALVEARMEALREEGVPALRERFAEEAAALGVTVDEVVGVARRKPGRPRRAKEKEPAGQA